MITSQMFGRYPGGGISYAIHSGRYSLELLNMEINWNRWVRRGEA